MSNGHPTLERIDYKKLRMINPEAARRAVLEYLKSNGGNISQGAQVFGINRTVIYDILRKEKEGDLKDRSRAPLHQPRRTPAQMEEEVIRIKCQTRYGPERLSRYLKQQEGLCLPPGTIRHILRRNREKISPPFRGKVRKERREFVNWYEAKPFEIVQVDLKYIRDHKALSREQIIHLDRYDIPNYQ